MLRALVLCAVVFGCKGNEEVADDTVGVTPAAKTGSGKFSAALSAELGASGTASAPASAPASGWGSASASASGSASASASGSGSGSGSGSAPAPGSGTGTGTGTGTGNAATAPTSATALRAIQLSLLPNWDRDVVEPGTISLEVKLPGGIDKSTFVFGYGYDVPDAPIDREAYKKLLAERKLLRVTTDRQQGAAWLLEGVDNDGTPSFRVVVTYGGRRLVCYGSLYKASTLGDTRDEVVLQAKKICETLAL